MERSSTLVISQDGKRLETINSALYHRDSTHPHYINSPVFQEFMARKNFGAKSGVIVVRCRSDGIWLDGGELKRLLEWKKAGGQLLHEMVHQNDQKSGDATVNVLMNKERIVSKNKTSQWENSFGNYDRYDNDDLVTSVFRLIDKLF